jgi:predicted Zn-dependent protease
LRAIRRIARIIAQALLALLALLIVWQAARLVFRPDNNDALRAADALFAAGRYHDARLAYADLLTKRPQLAPALVRQGIVATIRGERAAADQALSAALGARLSQPEYDLVRLYQGQLAASGGDPNLAEQYWQMIDPAAGLAGRRRVLEAEQLLYRADYAGAEASYRAALGLDLPRDWRALAHTRLALLRASSDSAAALAELAKIDALAPAPAAGPIDWAAPLLPLASPDAGQLAAALHAPPDARPQLLGQLYLAGRLYALAEAQFAAVSPNSPSARAAAAYAAYTRWSAGDRAEGLRRLQALVDRDPAEPRARALLALAYLTNRDDASARAQLEAIRDLAPRAPDTQLAWGQWYAAQHDYVAAADAFQRALSAAPPDQRGGYALALARFTVDTTFQVCDAGRAAAEQAIAALPDDAHAWTTAAATRLSCGDAAGAQSAAARALRQAPASPEASYYLGRALAALGQRQAARAALINAADLAPSSPWRERAEAQIAILGL